MRINTIKIERLLLAFICFLFFGMLLWPFLLNSSTWDIHVHDTYFVIRTYPVVFYAVFHCCLLFVLYTIIRRRHGQVGVYGCLFHILITIVFILFLLFGNFLVDNSVPRRYLDYSNWSRFNNGYTESAGLFAMLALLFVVAQAVFLIYFLVKIIKKGSPILYFF